MALADIISKNGYLRLLFRTVVDEYDTTIYVEALHRLVSLLYTRFKKEAQNMQKH